MFDPKTRRLFAAMVREEWRMHETLFAGRRFAVFPVVVALLSVGTTTLLVVTGREPGTIVAGMHALVFVFGLHTGSIGFVGRDAIRNLVGEMTLLVFSARTLPLSRRRLFGVFLVKDVAYYSVLFMLPIAIGGVPLTMGPSMATGLDPGSAVVTVALLWATLSATFALGIGTSIAALGVSASGLVGRGALVGVAGLLGLAWVRGVDVLAATPYGLFQVPSFARLGLNLVVIAAVLFVGAFTFSISDGRASRSAGPTFGRWQARIDDPVATKTLLDVHRSSGGFGKVVFSGAVLLGVTAALVDLAAQITGVSPSVGISFGAILGFSGFTTYNWLTQFDGVEDYGHHPLDVAAVFRAKFRAFLFLGPIVGLGFYAIALGVLGARLVEALVGGVLLVGVATYIFGVTVYLTGLSPNEFLFDTLLFAVFGLAVMVPLVPVLIVGFALAPVALSLLFGLGIGGVALGGIGVGLYRRSLSKWTRYHRE